MSLSKKQVGYIFVADTKLLTDKINDIFNQIGFYVLESYYDTNKQRIRYKGYCSSFDEIDINETPPTYELTIHMNTEKDIEKDIEIKRKIKSRYWY